MIRTPFSTRSSATFWAASVGTEAGGVSPEGSSLHGCGAEADQFA